MCYLPRIIRSIVEESFYRPIRGVGFMDHILKTSFHLVSVALLVLAGCSGFSPRPEPHADAMRALLMAGSACFSVETSGWAPNDMRRSDGSGWTIKLDTARFSPAIVPEVRAAYVLSDGLWRTWPFSAWQVAPGDSIDVRQCSHVTGADGGASRCPPSPGGYSMRVIGEGDSLRGRVQWRTDLVESDRPVQTAAPVVGVRVPCR
jgi:hypothetical protein